MERRHQLRAAVVEDPAAQARDRIVASCSSVCAANVPSATIDLRLDRVDLAEEERLAGRDLVRLGIAVARRPALDHVGDVDLVAVKPDRLDDLRQQLPGAADERDALDVLVGARRLADEHQVRRRGCRRRTRPACGPACAACSGCSRRCRRGSTASTSAGERTSVTGRTAASLSAVAVAALGLQDQRVAMPASTAERLTVTRRQLGTVVARRHAASRLMPVTPSSW